MEDRRVARRYASALFQAARNNGTINDVEQDLGTIVGLLKSDPDFKHFIVAPYTSRDARIGIMDRVFTGRVTPLTMQVFHVLLAKRREHEIEGVFDEYVKLRREHERILHAVITSATPLDEAQRTQVVNRLQTVLNKTIEPDFKVDARLIGGVRVTYENFVLDGSVRGALTKLRDRFRYDLLKQQG